MAMFLAVTEESWSSQYFGYKPDTNLFIFSLINLEMRPLKMKWSQNNAIGCFRIHGPVFGGDYSNKCDFRISFESASDSTTSGLSNLGYSYSHADYVEGSNEAKTFLAGLHEFQALEVEVQTIKIFIFFFQIKFLT